MHTCEPLPEQQTNLVLPREQIDEHDTEHGREEVDDAHVRTRVGDTRREVHAREDRRDLDEAVHHREQRRLQRREPEVRDDELLLVRERVGHVVERGEEREEPRLRVRQRLDELLALPSLVLDTGLVLRDALHCEHALLGRQEPRGRRRVGEHEEEADGGDEGEDTGDDDQPLPGLEVARIRVEGSERDEAYDDLGYTAISYCMIGRDDANIPVPFIRTDRRSQAYQYRSRTHTMMSRTPVANSQRLFLASVEHARHDHKARRDRAFAHPEYEAASKETAEVLACGVAAERNTPHEDVQAIRTSGLHEARMSPETHLIHLPTGNRCSARFCGYSNTR